MPNYTDPAELLAVVDADDNEIGAERRDVIHRDNLLHRAIHLFIFRTDGRLLLQQRSEKKDQHPLCWECVGGHLGPGENYDDCAIREAREELGINLTHADRLCKIPASPATGYEFITVYKAISDEEPTPNRDEIIAIDCHAPAQWKAEIDSAARRFSPTLLYSITVSGIIH
jgi:isopentenyl-diphosphate delta-isomerase type 1